MQANSIESVIPTYGLATLQGFDTRNAQEGQRVRGSGRQYVRFYNHTESQIYATKVKINEKTGATVVLETATRPITREYVEIIAPGDKNEVNTIAEDHHKREFFEQYRAFREGRVAPIGKSLDECTYIAPHIVTELNILRIVTEEQLADASELVCGRIADGFSLREFARASVKANASNKPSPELMKVQVELEKSNAIIAQMQAQLARLDRGEVAPRVANTEAPAAKQRGRPKKITTDETHV